MEHKCSLRVRGGGWVGQLAVAYPWERLTTPPPSEFNFSSLFDPKIHHRQDRQLLLNWLTCYLMESHCILPLLKIPGIFKNEMYLAVPSDGHSLLLAILSNQH